MNERKRKRGMVALISGNIILFFLLLLVSVMINTEYRQMMIDRSVKDVDHINQSTIDMVVNFFEQQEGKVDDIKEYVEYYHMTPEAALEYIYRSCANGEFTYQLTTIEGKGFEARKDESGNFIPVDYTDYKYEKFQRVLLDKEDTDESITVLSGFENASAGGQNVVIWKKLNLKSEDGSMREYSLLSLISTDVILEELGRKQVYDGMTIVFMDDDGDVLFTSGPVINSSNIFTHIAVYNDLSDREKEEMINEFEGEGRMTLFYKNSKGVDSVFAFSNASTCNWYSVTCIPLDSFIDNELFDFFSFIEVVVIIVLLCMDISWIKALNRRMDECLKEAASVNSAKADFLSRVSQDIWVPMNGIIGTTQMALRSLDDKEKAQEYLQKTERSSKNLLSILNDLVDMSRAESGQIAVNETKFSLAEVLSALADQYSVKTGDKEQFFDVVLHQEMDEVYVGDALKLSQLLGHLLSNAVKFTPKGGEIQLEVSLENREDDKQWISFHVIDTGLGVAPENQDRIFDMFEKGEQADASQGEGTGLGLSIVKRLVSLMGGIITVKSEVGEGSVFRVLLPFGIVPRENRNKVVYSGKRAIVIVSNIVTEYYLKEVLDNLGIEAEGVKTVESANTLMFSGSVDFCITDTMKLEEGVAVDAVPILLRENNTIQVYEMVKQFEMVRILSIPAFRSDIIRAIDRMEAKDENEEESQYSRLRNRNILLVEDNDLNREIASELLEEIGAHVEVAVDGQDAVEIFAKSLPNHFELILMSIQMPRMNGLDATKEIRALDREDAKFIPIFAMLSNTFAEDINESMEAGMNDYIAKPVDLDKLCEKINLVFQREKRNYT